MRLSDELAGRIDRARGGLPRATWMKGALEKALEGSPSVAAIPAERAPGGSAEARSVPASPRASEVSAPPMSRPKDSYRRDPARVPGVVRASSLVKQGVRPIPKGEK